MAAKRFLAKSLSGLKDWEQPEGNLFLRSIRVIAPGLDHCRSPLLETVANNLWPPGPPSARCTRDRPAATPC